MGGLVPGAATLLRTLQQIFVLQEGSAFHLSSAQKFIQIGTNTGLSRVDLQSAVDGQGFQVPAAPLALLRVGVLVVGDDATVQGGVADLSNAGSKGVLHRLKTSMPVVGVGLGCGQGWNFQQGQVGIVGELLVDIVIIVPLHAAVQNGIGNGLDEVAVVVGAAQPLRCQTVSRHHNHIGEVAQVMLAQCVSPRIHRQLQFLVPGDMGIAQQSAAVLMVIGGTRSKEAVLRKEISHHLITEVPLTGQLEYTGRDQLPQQLQQVAG